MLINYIKKVIYLTVLSGFSLVYAGSFEDFFKAIELDDEVTISKLLQRGFDANTVNPAGVPGLLLAIKSPAPKVARVLANWPKTKIEQRNSADESALMMAALTGDLELCQMLIKKDADVNKPGWTPLHYAATNGQLPVIRFLLDEHAYIDAESPNRTTPLMMAAMYGTPEAVKVLLEAGADPLLKNMQGLNALDFAERVSRTESAEIIRAFVRGMRPKGTW
jgi:ankyrin repeat protein